MTTKTDTPTDSLGIPIELQCTVRVLSYGLGARLVDCGATGQVVGLARTRVRVELTRYGITRIVNIDPACLGVLDDAGRLEGWNQ